MSETTRDNRRLTAAVLAAPLLALVAGACSGGGKATTEARGKRPAVATTTTTVAPTTTTVAPTTTTAPPPKPAAKPLPGLGPGARGPVVLDLEKRLDALHYDVGAVDGVFDSNTTNAERVATNIPTGTAENLGLIVSAPVHGPHTRATAELRNGYAAFDTARPDRWLRRTWDDALREKRAPDGTVK